MKICKKCGKMKSMDDFYVHPQMKDKHLNICKACTLLRISSYWYKNNEELRKKERLRYQRRKKNPEFMKGRMDYQRNYRRMHKNAMAAHNAVRRHLIPPDQCEMCGKPCKTHGHHKDYNEPLKVIWVCPVCHRHIHSTSRIHGLQ